MMTPDKPTDEGGETSPESPESKTDLGKDAVGKKDSQKSGEIEIDIHDENPKSRKKKPS